MIPRRVLFFDDAELALTGNAKIRAADLRDLAVARLATGGAAMPAWCCQAFGRSRRARRSLAAPARRLR
ncbi:MAG: hypothetical protein ACRDY6_16985 [Acidimicrobiia bacterium]